MVDYIKKIRKHDQTTQEAIYSFLDQIDPSGIDDYLRTIAFSVLQGQKATEEEFAEYKKRNDGFSLTEGQHPHYAYSGGSNASGHEKYFVGHTLLGETLVLRLPGSEWFDADGKMIPEVQAFIALVQSKDIKHIIHSKNDSSKMLEIAYAYHTALRRGDDPLSTEALKDIPPVLIDYAKRCNLLYKHVETNGLDFYARKGIKFDAASTDAEKFKLAMAAQALMWDIVGASQYMDPKPGIVPVLQSDFTASHYLYLEHENRFILIPDQTGTAANLQKKMETFFQEASGADDHRLKGNEDVNDWPIILHNLSGGYGLYLETKKKRERLNNVRLIKAASSSCTDSRTPAHLLLGHSGQEGLELYVLRAPGNSFVDNDGKLTETALRYLAIAKLEQVPVVHSHHSTCGAMNAATDHLTGKNTSLPVAFQTLGDARQATFDKVAMAGKTEKEIVDHYKTFTGVKVNNFADCLGLQQLLDDVTAAQQYKEGTSVVGVFHNTAEGQLYLFHKNRKADGLLFVKVPSIFSSTPSLGPTRSPSLPPHSSRQGGEVYRR